MQTINLCIGLPRQQKFFLNFKVFKFIVIAWVILLIGLYLVFLLNYLFKPYTLYQLEKKKTALNQVITQKSKEKNLGEKGITLEKEIEQLKKTISDKKNILTIFERQSTIRFSTYLKFFSEIVPSDVWLTKMDSKPQVQFLDLQGFSLSPPLVVGFLHDLESSVLFKSYGLKITQMEKEKAKDFKFRIQSTQTGSSNEK